MAGVMLLFLLFASPIISIFTNNPEVHAYGVCHCRSLAAAIFYGIGMVMIQALNGFGDTRTPTWINFLASGCFRYRLLSRWQVFKLGPTGAFIAYSCSRNGHGSCGLLLL